MRDHLVEPGGEPHPRVAVGQPAPVLARLRREVLREGPQVDGDVLRSPGGDAVQARQVVEEGRFVRVASVVIVGIFASAVGEVIAEGGDYDGAVVGRAGLPLLDASRVRPALPGRRCGRSVFW